MTEFVDFSLKIVENSKILTEVAEPPSNPTSDQIVGFSLKIGQKSRLLKEMAESSQISDYSWEIDEKSSSGGIFP